MLLKLVNQSGQFNFLDREVESIHRYCPRNAKVETQISRRGRFFVAAITVFCHNRKFIARSSCVSLEVSKRHCLRQMISQLQKTELPIQMASPTPRILVVDDDPIAANVAAQAFRRTECEVVTVTSGRDAIGLIASGEFDLLLLDWYLRDMDGRDVLRAAHRENCRRGHLVQIAWSMAALPVVIWSGRIADVDYIGFHEHFRILDRWNKITTVTDLLQKSKSVVGQLKFGSSRLRRGA